MSQDSKSFAEELKEYDEAVHRVIDDLIATYKTLDEVNRGIGECQEALRETRENIKSAHKESRQTYFITAALLVIWIVAKVIQICTEI